MANGIETARFNGTLPGSRSTAARGISWGANASAERPLTAAQLGVVTGASMAPYYSADVLSADLRGRMPNAVGGIVHDQDPVSYCRACGLNPVTEQDETNLRAYPALATDALARSVAAKGQAMSSIKRHAAVTVHASLGDTVAPYKKLPGGRIAQPKASFSLAI